MLMSGFALQIYPAARLFAVLNQIELMPAIILHYTNYSIKCKTPLLSTGARPGEAPRAANQTPSGEWDASASRESRERLRTHFMQIVPHDNNRTVRLSVLPVYYDAMSFGSCAFCCSIVWPAVSICDLHLRNCIIAPRSRALPIETTYSPITRIAANIRCACDSFAGYGSLRRRCVH